MKNNNTPRFALTAFALALSSPAALALDFEWHGLQGQFDSKFSVGMAWRAQARDSSMVGIANGGTAFSTNGDDGNLAYENWDVVSGGIKYTPDLSLTWGNYGLFARGNLGWNPAVNNKHFFNPADYDDSRTTRGFTQADRKRKEADVHAHIGHYAELLDLYAYSTQEVLGRQMSLRVGKQIINWGESTFVLNGLNSILAADANRLRVPGFELDEVLTPTNNVWFSTTVVNHVNFEAFYQLRWERTIIDTAGSFWGTNDFAGIGGTAANLGFGRANENVTRLTPCSPPNSPVTGNQCVPFGSYVPRGRDVTPGNTGQYGAALRFTIPQLNEMDLSFYGANYHSRLPLYSGHTRLSPSASATTADYFVEYPKNIKLYGLSFNTTLPFELSIQGEYSYKQDQPLQIDDVELLLAGLGAKSQLGAVPLNGSYIPGFKRKNVSQADIGLTRIFGPSSWLGSDQTIALFEMAVMHVHGLENQSVLRYEGPGTYTPGDAQVAFAQGVPQQQAGYATATSYGYKLLARFDYNNFLNILNLQPILRWEHDLKGISPTPLTNFVAGRRQMTASLGYTYRERISGDIGYTRYIGAGAQNLLQDRDYVEAVIKYSF